MRALIISFLLICCALLPLSKDVAAQILVPADESYKPDMTEPITVAMVAHRSSGQMPDFMQWATMTDDYKNAPDYDKTSMQEKQADELEKSFNLLATDEQIIVDFPAILSDYSLNNEGYLIDNFTPTMFFPFSYAGKNYAVVPKDVLEHQWLPVKDMPAKQIDDIRKASKTGQEVTLTLTLSPRFIRNATTITIDGKDYLPLATELKSMAIFGANNRLVWRQKAQSGGSSLQQNKLMNLYQ